MSESAGDRVTPEKTVQQDNPDPAEQNPPASDPAPPSEPVAGESVASGEPVAGQPVASGEPAADGEPVAGGEPVVAAEAVAEGEPVRAEEPVIAEEPVVAEAGMAEEPVVAEPVVVEETVVKETVLTGSVADGHRVRERAAAGDVWGAATDPADQAGEVDEASPADEADQARAADEARRANGVRESATAGPATAGAGASGAGASGAGASGEGGQATGGQAAGGRPVSQRAPARPRPAQPRGSGSAGPDLLGDLQRWLVRTGARSVRREIEDSVRRTLGGGGRSGTEDVWDRATTEPPPELAEAPECAWCPICQAARRMRDNGPGLSSQLAGASSAVATAVQDALGAVDAILSRPGAGPAPRRTAERSPGSGTPGSAGGQAERVSDEPGDRS